MFCDTNEIEAFNQKIRDASVDNAEIGDLTMDIRGWFATFFFPTIAALLGTIFLEDFKSLLQSPKNSFSFYLLILIFINLVSLYSLYSNLEEKNFTSEKIIFFEKYFLNYIVFLVLIFLIGFENFSDKNTLSLMIEIYFLSNVIFTIVILWMKNDVDIIAYVYFMKYFSFLLLLGNIIFFTVTVNTYYTQIYFILMLIMIYYVGALYCMYFSICERRSIYRSTKEDLNYLNGKIEPRN